ncbi:PAS domain-containing hybrid sensor histidine kinase/response regulator [Desulfosporosinus youngiae]|uniref:Circadian input-output histidine kinase CikA n=1 Tax=Desulfosporosinus youngiae DSM 17734 TaxID=768710 RepID=H5XSZ2_9FIRM|nr:PAS domain S-box protein [Desulfosporosinus youngiae]EHQ87955.1 PAS domain S-box [Desulfosporosinus youngiae DSM 17734]
MEISCREDKADNFQIIFNSSPIGMFVLNDRSLIEMINNSGLRFFDKQREDVLGKRFGNSFLCKCSLEDDRGGGFGLQCQYCELNIAVKQAIDLEKPTSDMEFCKIFIQDENELELWFRASINPIMIGGKRRVVVELVDITDSKNKEIAMIKSKDYYQKLLDDLPALIWKTDKEGRNDYFNKTWLKFTGLDLRYALKHSWLESLHPEDVERCSKLFKDAILSRRPFEIEHRRRYKQPGQYRWCITSGKPYFGLQGEFAGFIGIVYDITDRQLALESSRKYHVLLESAREIILFLDTEGQIIEANNAAVKAYGYKREELLSLKVFDLRENNEVTAQQLQEANNKGIYFETIHRRKNDSTFPVNVSSQGTMLGNKRVIVSIIRDITERKQAEMALRASEEKHRILSARYHALFMKADAANRAKSEFLANMSHEIRTPINGMIGMIDLTLLTSLNQEQKENLDIAKTCADSLLKIINDILDFSKMEAGKLTIENIGFDIKDLLEETIKMHTLLAAKKGLRLDYACSPTIPRILVGDPIRLKQILNNLLNNAVKFTLYGRVTLSVRELTSVDDKIELMFSVTDSGIGIAEEDQSRLFRTFSQVDGSITRKYGGTGLGLVISKQLVQKMGGTIGFKSKKGSGSSFYFTLKFTSSGESSKQAHLETGVTPVAKPLKILIVEDDKVNLKVLSLMLKGKGHFVDTASNGSEALLLHGRTQYDAIFMDIQMPIMDGIEATKHIRQREGVSRHTPIIALTAYALKGDKEKFLSCGMDEYIPKPINMETLFTILEQVVEKEIMHNIPSPEFMGDEIRINESGKVLNLKPEPFRCIDRPAIEEEIFRKVEQLMSALTTRDISVIEEIAHRIKVNCNLLEADEAKTYAFKIELAARRGTIDEVIKYSLLLKNHVEVYKKSGL